MLQETLHNGSQNLKSDQLMNISIGARKIKDLISKDKKIKVVKRGWRNSMQRTRRKKP